MTTKGFYICTSDSFCRTKSIDLLFDRSSVLEWIKDSILYISSNESFDIRFTKGVSEEWESFDSFHGIMTELDETKTWKKVSQQIAKKKPIKDIQHPKCIEFKKQWQLFKRDILRDCFYESGIVVICKNCEMVYSYSEERCDHDVFIEDIH